MGRAARANHARWAWLYRQPLWRRIEIAVRFFYTARRRSRLRGAFWGWLTKRGNVPAAIALRRRA